MSNGDRHDDEAALLAAMTAEIRALIEKGEPMVVAFRPLSAVQLAGLVQLALRHPGRGVEHHHKIGLEFIDSVRQYFAGKPAVLEILRRGDDPAYDTRRGISLNPNSSITHVQIAELRTAVAAGAGHECDEWFDASGFCALCDREQP